MSPEERETTIQFSDADGGVAHVYTAQPPMMRKLAKHPRARRVAKYTAPDGTVTGEEYEIPKDCIGLRSGRKRGQPLSEAQRKAVAERLRAARERSRALGTPTLPDAAG